MRVKHLLSTAFIAISAAVTFAQQGVGINSDSIKGQLHISTGSSLLFPQLRLTDTTNTYARIKFENTTYPESYWDFAGIGGNDTSGVPSLNMFYFDGNTGRDVLLMRGSGTLLRNSFGSNTYDYYYVNNLFRGGLGYDSIDFRIFTTTSQPGRIRMGTKNRDNLVIDALGNIGIGTSPDTVKGELHISTSSSLGFPQLRLTEFGNDYARIKFENDVYPNSYWDIAGIGGTDSTGAKTLNFYYSQEGSGRNLLRILGNGIMYRDGSGSALYDYYFTQGVYRGLFGFASEDLLMGTSNNSNGRVRIGTRVQSNLVIDTSGNVGIGAYTPLARLHVIGDMILNGDEYIYGNTFRQSSFIIASLASNGFWAGRDNFFQLALDGNDIQSHSYETSLPTTLYLQRFGGSVDLADGALVASELGIEAEQNISVTNYDSSPFINLQDSVSGPVNGMRLYISNGSGLLINNTPGYSLQLGTNGTSRIVIKSNGEVDLLQNNLRIGNDSRFYIGDQEYLYEDGFYINKLSGALIPQFDALDDLGSSTYRWQDIYASNGTIQTSDRRDKKNINEISYGLKSVLSLNPVSYQWADTDDQSTKLGLVAQEVLEVIPEVVKTHDVVRTEDGTEVRELERYGMYYSDLIPVLIQAIKEQTAIIDELKEENDVLIQNQIKIIRALEEAGIDIE